MRYCVFILLLLLLIDSVRKRSWSVGLYLVGVYTIMMYFAICLAKTGNTIYSIDSFFVGGLFIILLLNYLIPFLRKAPTINYDVSDVMLNKIYVVGFISSAVLIVGMILLSPYVFDAFSYGLVNIRNAMYEGVDVIGTYSLFGHIGHSILRWFGWLGYVNLLLFFYSIIVMRKRVLFKGMLIVSSLGSSWIGILNGGRSNTTYWLLFFFFCIALFYNSFSFKKKKTVIRISLIFITAILLYFGFITTERVAKSSIFIDANDFLLTYIGQAYSTFIRYFKECKWHPYNFRRELPLLTSLIFGRFNLDDYRGIILFNNGILVNGFSTFLGDIYVDIGLIGVIIFTLAYCWLLKRLLKNETFSIGKIIYLAVLFQVPLFGVFYYNYYRMECSVSIMIALAIARFLDNENSAVLFTFNGQRLFLR